MKQEIKDKLKRYSKLAVVIGGVLLWLVSFIGISAYSAYWIRENVSYSEKVKEPSKRVNSSNELRYCVLNSWVSTPIYWDSNEHNVRHYLDVEQTQENVERSITYTCEGDFLIYVNNSSVYYDRISIQLENGSDRYITLVAIYLRNINTGDIFQIYLVNNVFNTSVICLDFDSLHINVNPTNFITETYKGSIIDFYFSTIFNTGDNNFVFTFESGTRNLPNYLSSYTRLQYGQVILADNTPTWGLTIPMVFECNGVIYDNITLLYYDCFYYYNSAGLVIDNYDMFHGSDMNFPHICRYVLFGLYGKTLDYTLDSLGNLDSVSNGVLAMYMPYNGTRDLVVSESVTWHLPVYQLLQGLQVNRNYSTISVKEVDSIPFPNLNGTNLLPYNNLSIRDILGGYFNFYGDINGYNGTNYDVGLGNVFILISNAFQSMIPLLAIQIIPGITLGLLVMLPLIVTIILVILKLVKK